MIFITTPPRAFLARHAKVNRVEVPPIPTVPIRDRAIVLVEEESPEG
jgi:hypothetical protein